MAACSGRSTSSAARNLNFGNMLPCPIDMNDGAEVNKSLRIHCMFSIYFHCTNVLMVHSRGALCQGWCQGVPGVALGGN